MRRAVFVESNTTGTGALAVERLLARGIPVVFLTRARHKYSVLRDRGPDLEVIDCETNDDSAVSREVEDQLRQGQVSLLTFSEFYVDVVARVAERLGLRYTSAAAVETCRDKFEARRALERAGLRVPRFWRLGSEDEAERLAWHAPYPCVVKPPRDSSSHGVLRVDGPEELLAQYRRIAGWTENVRGQRLDGRVLVEELVEGPEHSVETFTMPACETRVVGVTDKHLGPPPCFVEVGHDFPSRAEASCRQALAETALAALGAVGFDFGPAHVEIRRGPEGPVVIEINPRLAGGMIPELVHRALGVDLLGAFLDLVLARPVDLEPRAARGAAIRFLVSSEVLTVAGIRGLEDARRSRGVWEVHLKAAVGDRLQAARDTYDRLGHVIAEGADAGQAAGRAERALRKIRIEGAPIPAEGALAS